MTPVKKVCVITGGTSGIGLCTAQAMLEKGYTVYELSRRAEGAPGMKHIMADVTKEETLAAAVQEILKQEDHIDVLINNAGFGISGAVNHVTGVDAETFIAVNSDPNAAIFNYCDYGIVADMDEVCDAMIARLKAR